MEVKILNVPSDQDWLDIRNDFLASKRKSSTKSPSDELRLKYLFSEHSPLYGLKYRWQFIDIPYWVSVQITRSHEGINHIVSSQRNDIQFEYDRKEAPQDAPVNHLCVANPVAIMTTSRKRLCYTASAETRDVWKMFLVELEKYDPILTSLCVKPCVYRNGICPEVFSKCKFTKTGAYQTEWDKYMETISYLKLEE